MKQKFLKNILLTVVIATVFIASFESCNKPIPGAVPITTVQNSLTINSFLTTDTSFSLYNAAIIRAGLTSLIADTTASVTMFAANNTLFRVFLAGLSGGTICPCASNATFTTFINSLPVTTINPIMSYLIIPGKEFVFTDIPTTFPNIQLPTAFTIGALPGTTVPVKMSIFPSRRATGFWLNTAPVTTFDAHYRNGVVHILGGVPTPPSVTVKTILATDTQDSLFVALIAKGDSGQVGLNRIDSVLNFALANVTVLAPSTAAIKTLVSGLSGGAVPPGAPTSTFIAVINSPAVSAQTARGIVVYHILADFNAANAITPWRAFSVNFPSTAGFFKTLFNGAPGASAHPGIKIQATFSGTAVTSLQLTGFGTFPPGGAPYSGAPANSTALDKHGINGVVHNIDKVLLPQ